MPSLSKLLDLENPNSLTNETKMADVPSDLPLSEVKDERSIVAPRSQGESERVSDRWCFKKEELENTPSRRNGIDADKERNLRQKSAFYIQKLGKEIYVSQLCINTAVVYMHRFYMFHPFNVFNVYFVATASMLLATKVEEQEVKLDELVKVSYCCTQGDSQLLTSDTYRAHSMELITIENILIQTLGFDVSVEHPHIFVVKCCELLRASKDLSQAAYCIATSSLYRTTMCLQYPPSIVACICINLARKSTRSDFPQKSGGKEWYCYVNDTLTSQQLEALSDEFMPLINKSSSGLEESSLTVRGRKIERLVACLIDRNEILCPGA